MAWLYNRALTEIVNESCSHGPTCPMWGSIRFQTNISLAIISAVAIVGLYFIFFARDDDKILVQSKKVEKKDYSKVLKDLSIEERYVMNRLIDAQGSVFQSDLVDGSHTKVKVTRILDRLEGKGLIERKRRGMTNIVLLKH
ncbi:MAG: helix-turn-helix transcriptional regulator [Candidatus Woesearchaeota archaeon]